MYFNLSDKTLSWSMWRSMSDCTKSCGGGIQYLFRACETEKGAIYPPDECGGGKNQKVKPCSTDPCKLTLNFPQLKDKIMGAG